MFVNSLNTYGKMPFLLSHDETISKFQMGTTNDPTTLISDIHLGTEMRM